MDGRAGFLLLLCIAACSDPAPSGPTPGGDALRTGDADGDASGDALVGDDGASSIPQLILDLRAGVRDAAGTVRYGDRHDGWPQPVTGGYLFVRLDDGGGPYRVAGDFEGWVGTAMQQELGLYWTVVSVAAPFESKYKYVDPASTFAADAWARRYGYDTYGEYSLVESVVPHLERFREVTDGTLQPRSVRIWVPAASVTHQIYVHDGQNLFDPNAMWGGWHLEDSLGPTTMAIGIDNTADRMDEYTHVQDDIGGTIVGGTGDAYADFVRDVVRPLIESEYGAAPAVGVMGSSLGGLISLHEALRDPSAWDFAASLSGTLGWGSIGMTNETLIERYASAGYVGVPIYLDSGGNDGGGCVDSDADGIEDDSAASDNYCVTRQMAATLEVAGWQYGVDLWHWWEPDAQHNEAAWAARVWRALDAFESL